MMKIDTGSNIKIRHTDGDDILSINPKHILKAWGVAYGNDQCYGSGSWERQQDGWEYDLSVPIWEALTPIQRISNGFDLRLHVEYVNTHSLSTCGYKQINNGETKAWFFGNPARYDKQRVEKTLSDFKSVIHKPFESALPPIIQLSDEDRNTLKDDPLAFEYVVVENNGVVVFEKASSIGFDSYLQALRVISRLFGTDCHVWCYAWNHFRYYQIRSGEDAFI